jgi:hypothetical protein
MDANRLRARFIKRQLQRALAASDMTFAGVAAREFRRYTEWFKHLLPDAGKQSARPKWHQQQFRSITSLRETRFALRTIA